MSSESERKANTEKKVSTASTRKKVKPSTKPISAKATYSKNTGKKLAESKTKLAAINDKIRNAVATGKLEASEQLELAQQAVQTNITSAEEQLSRLRKSSEESWEEFKDDVEDAWEHLSRSIKQLVDRFSDGSR